MTSTCDELQKLPTDLVLGAEVCGTIALRLDFETRTELQPAFVIAARRAWVPLGVDPKKNNAAAARRWAIFLVGDGVYGGELREDIAASFPRLT
jgi:hypothetical protein